MDRTEQPNNPGDGSWLAAAAMIVITTQILRNVAKPLQQHRVGKFADIRIAGV
jgi:hypothetical protein